MAYANIRGFDVDLEKTYNSTDYTFINGGSLLNYDTNAIEILKESKVPKVPGSNYIYFDGTELIRDSFRVREDYITYIKYDDDFTIIEFDVGGLNTTRTKQANPCFMSKEEQQARVKTIEAIARRYDRVRHTSVESITVTDGKIITTYDIDSVSKLYVPNQGELDLHIINKIERNIIFVDADLNNTEIEVTYNFVSTGE